jgi:hypothetical protein
MGREKGGRVKGGSRKGEGGNGKAKERLGIRHNNREAETRSGEVGGRREMEEIREGGWVGGQARAAGKDDSQRNNTVVSHCDNSEKPRQ